MIVAGTDAIANAFTDPSTGLTVNAASPRTIDNRREATTSLVMGRHFGHQQRRTPTMETAPQTVAATSTALLGLANPWGGS